MAELIFSVRIRQIEHELDRRTSDRLAKAELEAAEARERAAQIELVAAWRRLSSEQLTKLAAALRNVPATFDVVIQNQMNDPEAYTFARDLGRAFHAASIAIRWGQNAFLGTPIFGVLISVDSRLDSGAFVQLFNEVGIPVILDDQAPATRAVGYTPVPKLYVFIAPKPPPDMTGTVPVGDPKGAARPQAASGHRSTEPDRPWFATPEGATAVLTGALVFVGLCQLLVFGGQMEIMSRQAHISETQGGDSRVVQRAFVNVGDLTVTPVTDKVAGKPARFWRFTSGISNDGSTPTVDLRYIAGVRAYFDKRLPPPDISEESLTQVHMVAVDSSAPAFPLQFPSDPANLIRLHNYQIYSFLGAHGSRQVSWIEMPEDAFRWSVQHGWRTYFYGEAIYRDVFSHTIMHVSKFCFLLTGEDGVDGFKARAALCDYWNCADNECKDSKARYEHDVAADKARHGSLPPLPGFILSRQ